MRNVSTCAVPPAAAAATLALLAGCSGSDSTREVLAIEGSTDLTAATIFPGEVAVDPALRLVYVAGSMGQAELYRIDVSSPASMAVTLFAPGYGGGVAVDPVTHRVATTDGYGGMLGIFEPSGATYAALPITGCGGDIVAGSGGQFGISTQCVDTFHVYDPVANAIVFQVASGGVGSQTAFNAATGCWFQNRTPRRGGRNNALVVSPTAAGAGALAAADFPGDGFVIAADPLRNRLWFLDEYQVLSPAGGISLVDGTKHTRIGSTTVTSTAYPKLAIATTIGRAYYANYDGVIRVLDLESGAELDAFDFQAASGGFTPYSKFATDGERLYFIGTRQGALPGRFFVVGRLRV